MTTVQKSLVTTAIAVAIGTGIYESRRASVFEHQVEALSKQQRPLADQIQQLREELDKATNQVAVAEERIASLRKDASEVPKLRGQVTRWRKAVLDLTQTQSADAQKAGDPTESLAKALAQQVNQLRRRLEQMPDKKIPELGLLSDRDWFDVVKKTKGFETDEDYHEALNALRSSAKSAFGSILRSALQDYANANQGTLPTELSQLQPFFQTPVDDVVLQRYSLLQPGQKLSTVAEQNLVAETAPPVDQEIDTTYQFDIHGATARTVRNVSREQ
jgi:phage-related tail protein